MPRRSAAPATATTATAGAAAPSLVEGAHVVVTGRGLVRSWCVVESEPDAERYLVLRVAGVPCRARLDARRPPQRKGAEVHVSVTSCVPITKAVGHA